MKNLMWILCVILTFNKFAQPCNVPVFRYALERWHPEQFQIVFLYRDSLNTVEKAAATKIRNRCMTSTTDSISGEIADSSSKMNAEFHKIDVNGDVSRIQKSLWGKYMLDTLPKVIINFPLSSGISDPLWIGSPFSTELDAIYDSPVNKRITKDLLDGMTAVWVLLESGDRKKDDKAFNTLKEVLNNNEKSIVLPTLNGQDSTDYLSRGPALKISFDLIRLPRDNVAEANIIHLLEKTERPLVKMRNQPIAFPVFARGRVLHALAGDGINSKMITQANTYIAGPCACTVKAENPGTDLLMIDCWEKSLTNHYVKERQSPKTLYGLGAFLKKKEKDEKD